MSNINIRSETESIGIDLRSIRDKIDVILQGLYKNETNPELTPSLLNGMAEIIETIHDDMSGCRERTEKIVVSIEAS